MSLLRKILAEKVIRKRLEFGINENVRLIKLDNEERKKDGEVLQRNTYMTFGKFNKEGDLVSQSEFNYFNLKHDSEYAHDNLVEQLSHMTTLVGILNPEAVLDPFTKAGIEDEEDLEEALGSKKGCKSLNKALYEVVEEALEGKFGPESELLRIKVVTDKNGKWQQLPREAMFVEPMSKEETELSISAYENRCYQKGLEAPTPTADKKPGGKKAVNL